jgi:hypothetical protein
MNCKYCHLNTHYIDTCPTIICKNCKDIGHPQWLCKQKKNIKQNKSKPIENKYFLSEDIKKKSSTESSVNKNINYYLKISKQEWGSLVSID